MGPFILNFPFSKQRAVRSHDGSIHYVFKNIDDVFPFYFADSKFSATAAVDALKKVKGKIDAKHEKTVANILVMLNDKNGTMQMHFRAAYAHYQASPSQHSHNDLKTAILELRAGERSLRAAEAKTQALLAIISAAASHENGELAGRLLNDLLADLTGAEAIADSMKRVQHNSKEWQEIG